LTVENVIPGLQALEKLDCSCEAEIGFAALHLNEIETSIFELSANSLSRILKHETL
jgi:hypothetical protein